MDYGFGAVVSSRFADIFRNNCTKNGLVPVQVSPEVGDQLLAAIEADPALEIVVDVSTRTLSAPALGLEVPFPRAHATTERLLQGVAGIGRATCRGRVGETE